MRRKTLSVVCALISIYGIAALPQPQRSVQLGGTGPRPVLLGAQQTPVYSQQLSFGGPPLQHQQPQIYQQNAIPRTVPPASAPRPIVLPQGRPTPTPTSFNQPAIGSFPIPPNIRPQQQQPQQQLIYRSPVVSTTAAPDDDEYDDEEYEEQSPAPRPVVTTARPTAVQRGRQPVQQAFITNQPQRFTILQQPQPQQIQQQPQLVQQPRARQRVPAQQVQAQPQQAIYANQAPQQLRLGQDSRLSSSDRQTTPPPIQTLNRFMRNNDDGSITWGYENEDGTFKEETLGADCVVRGKYGYVDPDGQKREYEYQSGNPCDPNKRGQEELEDDDVEDVAVQQRLGGILSARPLQLQTRRQ